MRFQLYYFKFTRNILLSRSITQINPYLINQVLSLRVLIEYYQQFCFYTCVFFSSFLLLVTRQYPRLTKISTFSIYTVTLRKSLIYDFLGRVVNLALINNYKFLKLRLPKNPWNNNLFFQVTSLYFFPESTFLLNNTTTLNWFFYFKLNLRFNKNSNFRSKTILFNSLQVPLLQLLHTKNS